MKKILLLLLVLIGVVGNASATKRVYIQAQNGWATVHIHLFKGSSDLYEGGWPGLSCTRIGSTNWFYVDVDSEESEAKCMINSNGSNSSAEYNINLSTNNVIYMWEDNGTKLSVQSFSGYVLANSDRTKLSDLTQDGLSLTGTVDFSDNVSDTYFAVFPSFTNEDGGVQKYVWDVAIRPTPDGDSYWLSTFQTHNSGAVYNNGKIWLEKLHMKYEVSINLGTGTSTFSPSFTKTMVADYATFASDYAVAIPTGVTASYTTGVTNNVLNLTNFEKGIPANTGVLLYKSGGGEITFTPASTTDEISDNLFVRGGGETINSTDNSNSKKNYILTTKTVDNENATIGFYRVNSEEGNYVATDKAYLSLPIEYAAAREFFTFGEDIVTGIAAPKAVKNINGYYNLNGQRIAQPSKGLYIVNGKKVMVK